MVKHAARLQRKYYPRVYPRLPWYFGVFGLRRASRRYSLGIAAMVLGSLAIALGSLLRWLLYPLQKRKEER